MAQAARFACFCCCKYSVVPRYIDEASLDVPVRCGARTIERAAHQLELRDQPVVAFQELITFLGELFVEFFELVDPALQARDVAFKPNSRAYVPEDLPSSKSGAHCFKW